MDDERAQQLLEEGCRLALDGALEPAAEALAEADRLRPDHALTVATLALTLTDLGVLDDAEALLRRAQRLDAHAEMTMVAAARLADARGDTPRARALAEALLDEHPGSEFGHIALATADLDEGRMRSADRHLADAEAVEPGNPDTRRARKRVRWLRWLG